MPVHDPFPCRFFLFDLDGTLIDSKTDIAYALNSALARAGFKPLPVSKVAEFVGDGVQKLVRRSLREAMGAEAVSEQIATVIDLYLQEYEAHLLDTTSLHDGVREALNRLGWASFGVVTNKPERFSRRILEGLEVGDRFCVIVGGDTIPQRKPDPAPLQEAMRRCAAAPSETVMVGDSAVDVVAGKAAGLFTCGVTGGFRDRAELESAGCDLIISGLIELPEHFCPPISEGQRNKGA